jgi:hypothetical protein
MLMVLNKENAPLCDAKLLDFFSHFNCKFFFINKFTIEVKNMKKNHQENVKMVKLLWHFQVCQ